MICWQQSSWFLYAHVACREHDKQLTAMTPVQCSKGICCMLCTKETFLIIGCLATNVNTLQSEVVYKNIHLESSIGKSIQEYTKGSSSYPCERFRLQGQPGTVFLQDWGIKLITISSNNTVLIYRPLRAFYFTWDG